MLKNQGKQASRQKQTTLTIKQTEIKQNNTCTKSNKNVTAIQKHL